MTQRMTITKPTLRIAYGMVTLLLLAAALASAAPQRSPQSIREGSSPQLALDVSGTVRMIFGRQDTIFVVTSTDNAASFSSPVVVGIVKDMHLGNTRGPTLASSRNYSLVAAVDKSGNIHNFVLNHRTNEWRKSARTMNDAVGSAPEGLVAIAANDADGFYAVWLDLRDGRQNQIYFTTVAVNGVAQSANRRLYASPDGHVCECCRPSISISGGRIGVMFRNWLGGARDMYSLSSSDGGKTFSPPQKLGRGSWMLDACPMDGGALAIDQQGVMSTVWRREGTIYFARPGETEQRIAEGRSVMMSQRGPATYLVWQDGSSVKLRTLDNDAPTILGEGRLPQVLALRDGRPLAAWENDGKVFVWTR